MLTLAGIGIGITIGLGLGRFPGMRFMSDEQSQRTAPDVSIPEQRVWLAVVYPVGLADIFGAAWDKDRFHWTREAAETEALAMARDLGLSQIQWTEINEFWAIGRCHKIGRDTVLYGVTVRGVLMPLGSPPKLPAPQRMIDKRGSA
jgi:hypothetical protein